MITISAMLVALEIVLSRLCSINTAGLKIGFSFVPIVVAANLFGPVCAAVVYALGDLIGAILLPIGPYHPGFTICAAAMGFVYGLCLYKRPGTTRKIKFFPNVVIPAFVNNIVFGLLINTEWVAMLYSSKAYFGWFIYRLPEYAVLIPLNLVITPIILKVCDKLTFVKVN